MDSGTDVRTHEVMCEGMRGARSSIAPRLSTAINWARTRVHVRLFGVFEPRSTSEREVPIGSAH